MSQEIRVVPAAVLESALKSLAGVAPGRFAVEAELRAIVDAPVQPAVQDRESKVNELVELMDRLSGGMRHFAGAIIDAGWTKLVPPAGGEVERYQAVALFTEEGNKINYNSPGPWIVKASEYDAHVTRLQAENASLQQRLNTADQRVDELEDAATVASMRIRELDLTFGRYLLGMKAAVIADESGGNGMEWIFNGLAGPGELPPEDERDAQAYFDREVEGIDAGLSEVFAFHDARRKASQVTP